MTRLTSPMAGVFFFNDTATTEIYTLSLHDALPISPRSSRQACALRNPSSISLSNPLSDVSHNLCRILVRTFVEPCACRAGVSQRRVEPVSLFNLQSPSGRTERELILRIHVEYPDGSIRNDCARGGRRAALLRGSSSPFCGDTLTRLPLEDHNEFVCADIPFVFRVFGFCKPAFG